MNSLHGPVVYAGSAEGATVAATVAQNPMHVEKIVAVFPDGSEHASVRAGMLMVHPKRNDTDQLTGMVRFFVPLFTGHDTTLIAPTLNFGQKSGAYSLSHIALWGAVSSG